MLPVQSPSAKIFLFPSDANHLHIPRHPGPHKGAFRDRHGRKVGMRWTQAALLTRALTCGRRSRVVLTPRRWRQVLSEAIRKSDGGKKARSPGRARSKPLTPSRAGMPGDPGATVVTNARAYYSPRAAAGATGTRHSPRPLSGERDMHNSGASRRENAEVYLAVIASEAKQSISPRDERMDCFVASLLAMTQLAV
jgi:hypothetical protein